MHGSRLAPALTDTLGCSGRLRGGLARGVLVEPISAVRISRRDLMRATALIPCAAALKWPVAQATAAAGAAGAVGAPRSRSISFLPRAFVIDGQPVYLLMGSVDYFRCPNELWRDVLLRAKRSGLNGIAFCVAWNFHERTEGSFDFSGDADLGRFLDICQELGLYAFPRVGPFICDEWDAGGHPAWLYGKRDIELRTDHAPTLVYVQRWFDKLIPIIATRQVTRGGPVLLVQQENEYYFVGRPRVQEYQSTLIRMLRERGIEVPITDCNGGRAETRVGNSFMTQNTGGARSIESIHRIQPDKPAIVSELYTDYMNLWGWPITSYPTNALIYQQTLDTLAAGGMYAYFMFYACTNFGFWASSTWKSDESFVTTRYYARAPVAEGGALNESYWATKAVNQLARGAERFLTGGRSAVFPVTLEGPVRGQAVECPAGFLLFVQPQYPEKVESVYHTDGQSGPPIQTGEDRPFAEIASQPGRMRLPSGERFDVAEPSSFPSMLPYRLQLDARCRVDYCNATMLGLTQAGPTTSGASDPGRSVLYLRGEAGRRGLICVNGQKVEFVFDRERPVQVLAGELRIVALSRQQAERTWFLRDRVIVGPYYVGEERAAGADCYFDAQGHRAYLFSKAGDLTEREVPRTAISTLQLDLDGWRAKPLPEPASTRKGWISLAAPRGVEELGCYWGYSWYRASVTSDRARKTQLYFTAASDRLTVFANGERAGTWGRGRDATRDPLPITLARGSNELVFLCDNMGRLSEGALPDCKGIRGPAFVDAEVRTLPGAKWSALEQGPTQSWQFQTYREYAAAWSLSSATGGRPTEKFNCASFQLSTSAAEGLELSLLAMPQYAWILLDGRVVGEHAGDLSLAGGVSFSSFALDTRPGQADVRLDIVFYGDVPADLAAHVRLYSFPKIGALRDWAFKAWEAPTSEATARSGDPIWWETEFDRPQTAGPYFLVTDGLTKGQAYVNGRPLGRYWEIGPQHSLYVPEPWLRQRNRLAIFDENGASPTRVHLIRDAAVPDSAVVL